MSLVFHINSPFDLEPNRCAGHLNHVALFSDKALDELELINAADAMLELVIGLVSGSTMKFGHWHRICRR